jgi:hypothetical protein
MPDMNNQTTYPYEAAVGKARAYAGQAGERARDAAETAGSTASNVVDAVKERVHDVAAGASELAGKTRDTVQEWASSVGDAAVQAKDRAQEAAANAVEKVGDWGQDVTALIRRNPIPALLVAFSIGLFAARALRRS